MAKATAASTTIIRNNFSFNILFVQWTRSWLECQTIETNLLELVTLDLLAGCESVIEWRNVARLDVFYSGKSC